MTCFLENIEKDHRSGNQRQLLLFIFSSLYIMKEISSETNWCHYAMRILIVEDEPLIALNTQADLEAAGHSVVGIAITSREAVELAGSARPDLVLMDVRLAEGDGVEAASAIYIHLGIVSLFATSYVEKPVLAANAALGCLQKPYDQKSLVRSIQIVEQVMNGLEPTLPLPRNLKLYERKSIENEPPT
jgi:two-component system, response regulator PdtaR